MGSSLRPWVLSYIKLLHQSLTWCLEGPQSMFKWMFEHARPPCIILGRMKLYMAGTHYSLLYREVLFSSICLNTEASCSKHPVAWRGFAIHRIVNWFPTCRSCTVTCSGVMHYGITCLPLYRSEYKGVKLLHTCTGSIVIAL